MKCPVPGCQRTVALRQLRVARRALDTELLLPLLEHFAGITERAGRTNGVLGVLVAQGRAMVDTWHRAAHGDRLARVACVSAGEAREWNTTAYDLSLGLLRIDRQWYTNYWCGLSDTGVAIAPWLRTRLRKAGLL